MLLMSTCHRIIIIFNELINIFKICFISGIDRSNPHHTKQHRPESPLRTRHGRVSLGPGNPMAELTVARLAMRKLSLQRSCPVQRTPGRKWPSQHWKLCV